MLRSAALATLCATSSHSTLWLPLRPTRQVISRLTPRGALPPNFFSFFSLRSLQAWTHGFIVAHLPIGIQRFGSPQCDRSRNPSRRSKHAKNSPFGGGKDAERKRSRDPWRSKHFFPSGHKIGLCWASSTTWLTQARRSTTLRLGSVQTIVIQNVTNPNKATIAASRFASIRLHSFLDILADLLDLVQDRLQSRQRGFLIALAT